MLKLQWSLANPSQRDGRCPLEQCVSSCCSGNREMTKGSANLEREEETSMKLHFWIDCSEIDKEGGPHQVQTVV